MSTAASRAIAIQGAECTTLNGYDGTYDGCFCQSDLE